MEKEKLRPASWRTNHKTSFIFFGAMAFFALVLTYFQFYILYTPSGAGGHILLAPIAFNYTIIELLAGSVIGYLFYLRPFVTKMLSAILIFVIAAIHYGQFISLYYANDYITVEAFTHTALAGLLLTPFVIAVLIGTVIGPLMLFMVLCKWADIANIPLKKRLVTALVLSLGIVLFASSRNLVAVKEIKWSYQAQRKSPLIGFFLSLKTFLHEDSANVAAEEKFSLDDKDVLLASQYGIEVHPDARYPFVKPNIYDTQLSTICRGCNVITLFVESLSARLIGAYGAAYKDLTPALDHFAARSLLVTGYYNHAFPTIPALSGTLCSIFPRYSHTDWDRAKFKLRQASLHCLPHMLSRAGYETTYFGYSHPNETYFKTQMADFGFTHSYFYDEITRTYFNELPARGSYGNSDRQMLGALRQYLQKRSGETPFYIALSTIETHPGMDVVDPKSGYGDRKARPLNTVHNFDHEFGEFWNYFVHSPYAANTILVVTADHAHSPSVEFASVAGPDYQRSYFDVIPLMVYTPTAQLKGTMQVTSSSIDYAPTMAHMLGLANQKNHFMGTSLFQKKQGQGTLGLVDRTQLLIYRDKPVSRSLTWRECGAQGSQISDECRLYRLLLYSHQIIAEDRLWSP